MSCPVCGSQIHPTTGTILHQLLSCHECLSEFEVTAVEPLGLRELPMDEEDWGE